jgi:ketosteroid isomerase-like protein
VHDDRGFLVWEEALRLVRGRDRDGYTGMFAPDGVVELPSPLPGMGRPAGPRGQVRTVRVPVWRPRSDVGAADVPGPGVAGAPGSDVLVIEFDLKGVEASGLPYRLGYVHVVTASHEDARGRAAGDERNKSVVRRCLETWSAPDFDGIERLVAAGCVDHAHPGLVGPEASVATARRLLGLGPSPTTSIDTLVGDGDLVAARTTVRHAIGGEAVVTSGMTFFHVTGGKIAEQWSCHPHAKS